MDWTVTDYEAQVAIENLLMPMISLAQEYGRAVTLSRLGERVTAGTEASKLEAEVLRLLQSDEAREVAKRAILNEGD